MQTTHVTVKALRELLDTLDMADPCVVQASRALAYAEREMAREHHREGQRMLVRAAYWLDGAPGTRTSTNPRARTRLNSEAASVR